jgi:hypothetical protein
MSVDEVTEYDGYPASQEPVFPGPAVDESLVFAARGGAGAARFGQESESCILILDRDSQTGTITPATYAYCDPWEFYLSYGPDEGNRVDFDRFDGCDAEEDQPYVGEYSLTDSYGTVNFTLVFWQWYYDSEMNGQLCGEEEEGGGEGGGGEGGGGGGGGSPTWHVECSPLTVVRGGSVTCTASSQGALPTITGWKFIPDTGATLPSVVRTISVSSTTWQGTMVWPGVVRVSSNSAPDSVAVVHVNVAGRSWSWHDSVAYSKDAAPVCPPVDTNRATGGFTTNMARTDCTDNHWTHLIEPDPDQDYNGLPGGVQVTRVPSGPNENLWYFTQLNASLRLGTRLTSNFRQNGTLVDIPANSPVVSVACADSSVIPNATSNQQATRWDVNRLCFRYAGYESVAGAGGWVFQHEKCHVDHAITEFRRKDILAEAEAEVRANSSAREDFVDRLNDARQAIADSSLHKSHTNTDTASYLFRYGQQTANPNWLEATSKWEGKTCINP